MSVELEKNVENLENLNVAGFEALVSPGALSAELPAPEPAKETVAAGRRQIEAILSGQDDRLLAIVGPCSIHDVDAAEAYAEKLAGVADEVRDRVLVVMRTYFEKPRTTTGWKGLINDPFLYSDREFDLDTGLRLARKLLLRVAAMNLPAGTEFLDPFTPQYLDDLISWAAIGARTTESQTHRQMASGLSMPVGFKNATTGDVQVALDAMKAARSPHHFLGMDEEGRAAIVSTRGNPYGHVILRGGKERTNFHSADIADAAERCKAAGLPPRLMVDCSHANSAKRFERQEVAWKSVVDQRNREAEPAVIGLMLESNLEEGNQALPDAPDSRRLLRFGVSVTDACIGWDATRRLLHEAAANR